MHDDVRDVAVHEHVARREADDLVRRDAAVGAADPEVLGRLVLRQLREEAAVPGDHLRRPGAIVRSKSSERSAIGWTLLRGARTMAAMDGTLSREQATGMLVGEVMIANPKTLPAERARR